MIKPAPRGSLLWLGGIVVAALAGALLLALLMLPRSPDRLPREQPAAIDAERDPLQSPPEQGQALQLAQLSGAREPLPLGGEVADGKVILVLSALASEGLRDATAVKFLVIGPDQLHRSQTPAVENEEAEATFSSLPPGAYRWSVAVRGRDGREQIYSLPGAAPTAPHFLVTMPTPVRLGVLAQYARSGERLPPGGKTQDGVVLKIATEGGSAATLVEVEVKPLPTEFDGAGLRALPPGGDRIAAFDLTLNSESYRWRSRARDGEEVTAWQNFGIDAAADFVVVQAPRRGAESRPPTPEVAGLVAQESVSAEGGEGAHRPNPSVVPSLPHLWTMLRPFALVLAAIGFAVAVLGGAVALRRHLKRMRLQ